jgi:2-amino-4-hydroxy-6-hydroxymethyldihydropteridine diphosphokinase
LKLRTMLLPQPLMEVLHALEALSGRARDMTHNTLKNAPRPLDLDLIAFNEVVIEGKANDLTLPHPRAHERGFVMGPLAEIAPEWLHPVLNQTAISLYEKVTIGQDAYKADSTDGLLRGR